MSRFEAAAFLHPQFGSLGSLVFAYVRVGHELTAKAFVAKSIKLVFPIAHVFERRLFEVFKRRGEFGPEPPERPATVPRILPSSQGASLKCPVSGPPKEFFDRYGLTGGCRACKSMAASGTRKGLSHSRACCVRYETWLRSQVSRTEEGMEVEMPVAPDAMREALSELADDEAETRQNRMEGDPSSSSSRPSVVEREAVPEMPAAMDESVARSPGVIPSGRLFTRGCLSCESGMEAPGIRHNAECKRRNPQFYSRKSVRFSTAEPVAEPDDDREITDQASLPENIVGVPAPSLSEGSASTTDEDEAMPMCDPAEAGNDVKRTEEVLRSSNTKRSSEVAVEDLERELRQEQGGVESCLIAVRNSQSDSDVYMPLSCFVAEAFQISHHVPLLSGLVDSVQFAPNATSVVVPFGKRSHLRI